MTFLLLYLFACFSIFLSVKLPEDRRSCKYKKILIESQNFRWKEYKWILPESRSKIIEEECRYVMPSRRPPRSVRTKLPADIVFRNFSEEDSSETLDHPEDFRRAFRSMMHNVSIHPIIMKELQQGLANYLNNHLKPYLRIGRYIRAPRCIGNRTVELFVQVLDLDELIIWKCEDIGVIKNNNYEYYKLTPVWMVEDEDNNTFKINLNECKTNHHNHIFCQPDVKVYFNSTCSINKIDTCGISVGIPREKRYSVSRILPDGVSVYGSIQQISKIRRKKRTTARTKSEMKPLNYDTPGLFYFNFNTTKNSLSLSVSLP
ncbi:hypothetical protein GCK72_016392 [Caenorhabditis remanei]|uniref:Uncharacterized protein n=1 Tax=Caenorhabditis remanei TaxID=31234 RepID=A0A6A5G4G8_CAERE|nr:hypothetical protein GCK72_016392 [Caenorhabditis remanei]KAF1749847.1 hypothetical protein GCK72_016392 [Caenorhabditis remanei]